MGVIAPASHRELRGVAPAEAVDAWLQACERDRLPGERVATAAALGRVTAQPVWALRSSPAFPAAAMDGIAVRAADTTGAGVAGGLRLPAERFDVVDTGDPLPPGRDAVVMRESVDLGDGGATIAAAAPRGGHVRQVGEDVAAGELLFVPGQRLRPVDLALAAAAGVAELTVRRRALVSILPTGDELRPAAARLAPGELADTNSLMMEGQAREAGCVPLRGPILPDDPDILASALLDAAGEADLVILVAGTSAGRDDHAPAVLRRCGRVVVQGVAMRPGHPAVLGVVRGTPVMACPGYPVSAALAFDALALPLVAALERADPPRREVATAELAAGVGSKAGSRELLRVRLGTVEGRRVAVPLRRGASVLSSLAHADALVAVPAHRDHLLAGARVAAERLRACVDATVLVAGAPDPVLDRLALALGGGRLGFCEMAPEDAVALVRDGGCHAAAFSGPPDDPGGRLLAVRLADVEVVVAFADGAPDRALRPGDRVTVGPRGTPARRLLESATAGLEIVEARSDAAALSAVAAGHAECAVGALAAACAIGLRTAPLGRAPLHLVVRHGAADRDPAVRELLETTYRHIQETATL